ncbi:MAG: hypothetical protein M0P71_01565 [Melioribacteraceae bacterium]|nr:hypothetical protein [Melioribacteraceae bacterium]
MKAIEIDWKLVQEYHNNEHCLSDVMKNFKVSRASIDTAVKHGCFVKKYFKQEHTEETKKAISEKRKKWLADNPDKHVWKRKGKFKSEPCEVLKKKT